MSKTATKLVIEESIKTQSLLNQGLTVPLIKLG